MAYKKKADQQKACRDHYSKNKESYINRKRERVNRLKEYISWYKEAFSCEVCGENHPATLVFHHKDPQQKDMDVSRAVNNGWSLKRLQLEIAKCQLLCENCHRKLHWDNPGMSYEAIKQRKNKNK